MRTSASIKAGQRSASVHSKDALTFADRETIRINILRSIALLLVLCIAAFTSWGVYYYAVNSEKEKFEAEFATNANRIIDSFNFDIERKLGAINAMADSITNNALVTQQEFPFVTIPRFAVRGANARIQADTSTIVWTPLVTDEKREQWEEYALANRLQVVEQYEEEVRLRTIQDEAFGFSDSSNRKLQAQGNNWTVLDDESYFHPKIWASEVSTDEPEGTGPYLPIWQRRSVFALGIVLAGGVECVTYKS